MKITHDKEADAMMIYLSEHEAVQHRMINPSLMLRLDAQGHVVSVELLDVSAYVSQPDKLDYQDITRQAVEDKSYPHFLYGD